MVQLLAMPAAPASALNVYERVGSDQDGQFTVMPAREEVDVEPGGEYQIKMQIFNHTGQSRQFELIVSDLQAAAEPTRFVTAVDEAKFGAKTWLNPEVDEFTLKPAEEAVLYVDVNVPLDAPVGSNYAAIAVTSPDPLNDETGDGSTNLVASGLSQLLFNVPGDIVRDGEITKTEVSDRYFFRESLFGGGGSFVRYTTGFANNSNVSETVKGEIVIRSMFGNAVKRFDVGPMTLLRDSEREVSQLWTDVPKFGRFTATVELTGDTGVHTEEFDTVTILPPWWWLAILAVLIAVPVILWWRNRNLDWEQYLDEDWDEEADEALGIDD